MRHFLPQLPADERPEVLWAALAAFLILVAHAILETARDALFLTHLPTARLPWVYLAVALLAVLGLRLLGRSGGPRGDLYALVVVQVIAAAGTACFLLLTRSAPPWAFYALYVWGGLASTVILIRFWLLLSDRFTATDAKRVFPIVAAGPLLGAVVGYAVAGLLSRRLPPGALLGASAGAFLLSAGASAGLWRAQKARALGPASDRATDEPRTEHRAPPDEPTLTDSVRMALRHPYVRRVVLLLLVASATVTVGDFIFKTVVARVIPPERLSAFLATTYFAFDVAALALLVTAVVPFIRWRGVAQALALEPALLLGAAVVFMVTGGLAAVVALRGVDGALRWSLHNTATELLYVPLSPRLRSAVKAMSDVVAHRGGQAIGSLLILGVLSLAHSDQIIGALVIGCAGAWIGLALWVRRPYVALFRESLDQAATETRLAFPDLDMTSLETLMTALSSPDEDKVIAAMSLLQQSERVRLIPTLILYHPSGRVIGRALELFSAEGRDDMLPLAERLLEHPDKTVQAAAMRAITTVRPDPALLQRASESASPDVAVTALVALAASGTLPAHEVVARLEPFLTDGAADAAAVRLSIARALRDHPQAVFAPLLGRLAAAPEPTTRCEAVLAMGAARDERHLPMLITALASRELRGPARDALLALGERAFSYLEQALVDPALPRAVRVHLPRTISRFPAAAAAAVLLRQLMVETSGTVRFKILRGLGGLIASDPAVPLDDTLIDEVVRRQLMACFKVLRWRVALQRGAEEDATRRTVGHELLADLLEEKEALALQRLFRALGLKLRAEDLERIYDGLQSSDPTVRSSSRELLQDILPSDVRHAVAALVDDAPDTDRLAAAGDFDTREQLDYRGLLASLLSEASPTLWSLAAFHAGELGLTDLPGELETGWSGRDDESSWLYRQTLERLGRRATPAPPRRAAG